MINRKILYNYIPGQIFSKYYEKKSKNSINKHYWKDMSENEIWYNMCLCLLSSNVFYELALSVTTVLCEKGLLNHEWINSNVNSIDILSKEMAKPQFEPIRNNGSYRKYRYHISKAKNIVENSKKIYNNDINILNILNKNISEYKKRNSLVNQISGFGLKQTSHFLRNIGCAESLAIIDTHIVKFLGNITKPPILPNKNISKKKYFELEQVLQDICKTLNLELTFFDMAIWEYMRMW